MGKMFKTVYPQSVDNDNLLKIGEMRIDINPSNNVTQFYCSASDGISKKSVKNGYITNEAGNVNNGNTSDSARVFLSPSSTALIIDNKYKLNELQVILSNNVSIDLSDLRYTDTMTKLNLKNSKVSGSLSDISNMTNLISLILSNTNVSGSLSDISNMANMQSLDLSSTNVSGSLSDISNMTNLISLLLNNTNVTGDLSELPAMLTTFSNYKGSIGGRLSSLRNIINLTHVEIGKYVTGDISDIDSLTKLNSLTIPSTITHTDAQVRALQDKGVTVAIY